MGVIAEQIKGRGMTGVLKYIFQAGKGPDGKRPVVIDRHHIHGSDLDTIGREFAVIRAIAGPGRHVLHVAFSWRPEECPSREERARYIREWTTRMGYGDCPCLVAEHLDTDITHDHLALLRVDGRGEVVRDSHDYCRSSHIRAELDREFGLRPEPRFRDDPERPLGDGKKARAVEGFREALESARTWTDLRAGLAARGLDLVVTFKSGGEIQGIGVRDEAGGYSPASKLHRRWSYAHLDERLEGDLAEDEARAEALAWLRARPSLDEAEITAGPVVRPDDWEIEHAPAAPRPRPAPEGPGEAGLRRQDPVPEPPLPHLGPGRVSR